MQLSQLAFLVILHTAMAQVNVPSAADIAECGELGVLTYNLTDLPEGVDPKSVRKCAGHPGLPQITPEIAARDGAPVSTILGKRSCWYGTNPYGCSSGFCWKSCGSDGEWCFTAQNDGWGAYNTCNTNFDCNEDMTCAQGDCAGCGCSCHD
ncbi:hypothetical protein E1B28_005306 [Marasmius oreades]|uniref:IDI-2 n=1 Tax=Marasmius oreades TaxID=181124 RepID=A0A9P7V0G5_9AGAR|nr:uncharacterized protein E1B28_005306 [Marasmius oreades]KAG7097998.1 hypothetical protein E1B28_005306 [Marasmius oreades]